MKSLLQKTASRRGFTLAEALIVLAIIAVLACLAVPSFISAQKDLEALERNEAARTIFVAAQGSMSALRAREAISELINGSTEMARPPDFPDSHEWKSGEYFYISSLSPEMAVLLPTGAIEQTLSEGTYYIEYNCVTGMVYGVFYSQTSFTYAEALSSEREADALRSSKIGYYGGGTIDYAVFETLDSPIFAVHNDAQSLRIDFIGVPSLIYSLTVSDGENTASYGDLFALSLTHRNIFISGTAFTVVLDSLDEGLNFSGLFGELRPGAELQITLTASAGDGMALPSSASRTANSLFAALGADGTAQITNARHLQNLNAALDIASAELISDIDCGGFDFKSVSNEALTRFNGNGNAISNLTSPLFDTFQNGVISNVRLINCEIAVSGSANAGALVNYAISSTLRGCSVYLDGDFNAQVCSLGSVGAENTGGLVGFAENCAVSECFASLTSVSATSGSVGGLIGKISGGNVQSCYAASGVWDSSNAAWRAGSGIITSETTAGGLIGYAENCAISGCYSASDIDVLAGVLSMSTIADSYSAGSRIFIYDGDARNVSKSELNDTLNAGVWTAATEAMTKPYGQSSVAYPYPRITALSHIGDWQE